MNPARTYPARRDVVKLLVVDPAAGRFEERGSGDLPALLRPEDLLVVNDAATLPASLLGRDERDQQVEIRLAGYADSLPAGITPASAAAGESEAASAATVPASTPAPPSTPMFHAVLFGAGDWRQRTEDRPLPPRLPVGARLLFGSLEAEILAVSPLSPRLVILRFLGEWDGVWGGIFRHGRPVQYSYLAHPLPLWAVQTVYASRPWAFEMPSAGRPLSWELLLALRRAGVRLAAITHAAGLSATGDPALDAALPLPERFDIPADTVSAVARARRHGGRVVAVGTSVVRALEGSAAASGGILRAGGGVTDLRITADHGARVVDGLLTGIHVPGESHFSLLQALAPPTLLTAATAHADERGFSSHELGDLMLLLAGSAQAMALLVA